MPRVWKEASSNAIFTERIESFTSRLGPIENREVAKPSQFVISELESISAPKLCSIAMQGVAGESVSSNPRTQLIRIIKRAGLSPRPQLFQNLGSRRETEMGGTVPSMSSLPGWEILSQSP